LNASKNTRYKTKKKFLSEFLRKQAKQNVLTVIYLRPLVFLINANLHSNASVCCCWFFLWFCFL